MKRVLLKKDQIIYLLKKIGLCISTVEYCYQQCVETCNMYRNVQGWTLCMSYERYYLQNCSLTWT